MIVRHFPMKKARLSSFSDLIEYLTNTQNKQERVGKISISNCNSVDPVWAAHEVRATQFQNQRAKGDKTWHMLISFAPGEYPSEEVLKTIEDRIVASIGFKEHQRISVVHHDTDNLHVHIAINKIHPESFNLIEPYKAYKTLANVATELELEFGLQITNHQPCKGRSENLADDMEQHAGIESLMNWMKRHCSAQIDTATSWEEVHSILAQNSLQIRIRANGFVFCDDKGLMVKASSVSRSFSKKNLESRLGEFMPVFSRDEVNSQNVYRYEPLGSQAASSELYARYRQEREQSKTIVTEKLNKLREARIRLIDKTKKRGRIKRTALKLMTISRHEKKYLYQQISKTLQQDIFQIQKNYSRERNRLGEGNKRYTWIDWLKHMAEQGDNDALNLLRYRNRKNKGNYSLSGTAPNISSTDSEWIDSITKEGTEIYKQDKTVIKNDGKEIKITKGASIAGLKKAIEMAQQQYGDCIQVNGSQLFKKIILHIVLQNDISITFADSNMEAQRQKLTLKPEKNHEQPNRCRSNDRRRSDGSNEIIGTIIRKRRGRSNTRAKPDAFSTRQSPPTQSSDSLRKLSQLHLVQFAGRSEMLLQDHAHDKLERKGLQPDNHVRRKISGLRKKTTC